jgi:glycosyltransferase involved in cell wall biosynthesis
MACGLPAVVSDRVGCHPDLVIPGKTGFVYRCGDVLALIDSLEEVAARPGLATRLGDRARRHVAAYSIRNLVEGTVAAMAAVAGGAPGRLNPFQAARSC